MLQGLQGTPKTDQSKESVFASGYPYPFRTHLGALQCRRWPNRRLSGVVQAVDGLPVPIVPSAGNPAHHARPAPAEDEDGPEVGAVLLPRFLHQVLKLRNMEQLIVN